jgi:hypothetical protein
MNVDECWQWTGAVDSRGYGHTRHEGRNWRAHRLAWVEAHGPIPAGEGHHGTVVMHTCDNRLCINPAHLRLGTHAENMADMRDKGRRKGIGTGETNGRAKLAPEQVEAIRADTRGKRTIAPDYGISPAQVQRIRRGLQWVA